MTEQIRTVSRDRIARRISRTDASTLSAARRWLSDFLALG
jgi:mRNA-degrading endonuclease toxin of MazEF toxin-antitoxin module